MGIPPLKSCCRGAHAHRQRSWPSPTRRWGHPQRDRRPGGSLPGRGDEARRCCFHERRASGRHRSGQGPAIGRARLRAQPSSEPPGPHALRMACRFPAEFVPWPRTPMAGGPPPTPVRRRAPRRAEDAREHPEAAPVVGDRQRHDLECRSPLTLALTGPRGDSERLAAHAAHGRSPLHPAETTMYPHLLLLLLQDGAERSVVDPGTTPPTRCP